MITLHRPVGPRPALLTSESGCIRSVRADTPVEIVAAVLTEQQLSSIAVVDEFGGPAGVIALSDLLSHTDDADPIFAGRARRRWYELPPGVTAADLMTPRAHAAGHQRPAAARDDDDLAAVG